MGRSTGGPQGGGEGQAGPQDQFLLLEGQAVGNGQVVDADVGHGAPLCGVQQTKEATVP
jgi:hypothetical protein